ncbi:FAD-dependent oxidoreductase [Aspergillus saccharolyticus JOP 1030-1]|uniref:FAD dependent oxidoreductase superfamily n=1 Tax=Aspergillus saccharolyticus JOP 1030-1 TaxID=1450539 RepID=A0A319A1D0_9EURO|nr:FAD dependent oxidoreductase superfamily [Aspergillus saccharolyticus JOP 1030-1]PYH41302.1 FAD dependent oxidoreductase superfamily [Aspergillus saccharolyticus JOP 1030-1]
MGQLYDASSGLNVPFPQRPIIILGAGIIGCATARLLLQNGFRVVLVAEYLPGDQSIWYASAWAGAAWHAAGGINPEYRYIQAVTHRHLLKMAHEEPESGVCIVDAYEYLEQPPSENSSAWGKTVLSEWRDLQQGEYPSEFSCGWRYETLVTDPTIHMPYLGKKITELGGHFIRKRVESLEELYHMFPESSIFINASGIGSQTLKDVQDDRCFPERGQNVFYKTEKCQTMYFRNGQEYTYVIPRPMSHGVVLGGVKQADNLSPDVDLEIARDEIARAHRLAPDIVPETPAEEALSYIVGIRPSRRGGFRLDSERHGSRVVLSAYGFAGGGYAFSYGVADALVKMVATAEKDNVLLG